LRSGLRPFAAVRGPRSGALVAAIGVCLGLIVGCQSTGPSATATHSAIASPSSPVASASAPDASTSAPSPAGDTVTIDPSLLEILPPDVGGATIEPAPEAATEMSVDPSLRADAEAIATALAVSGDSSGAEDLVVVSVVRLHADVFDEAFFEGWRASYDRSACEPAGGLRATSDEQIGGRQVFVGSCTNSASTYHVRYGEDVIVSATSTGERRFGELLMAHLGA
jgi:hypothetical protein